MPRLAEIIEQFEKIAPLSLAEEWDNVGLLIGDPDAEVASALTCLTLTPDVAREAIDSGAKLVISHHPILFRPVQRITTANSEGRMLLDLIRAGVAVYSAHTAYDSARDGINQQLATALGLQNIAPIRPKAVAAVELNATPEAPLGSGRCGTLPKPLKVTDLLARVKNSLGLESLQFTGDEKSTVTKLGIACGSAAEFLRDAHRSGCQALLTGEARFHALLEARELGIALILAGHYATEKPAMEQFAVQIESACPGLRVAPSLAEDDPVNSI
jgi:dinuclear metal center YbgI/SA1388 family protein